MISDIKPYPIIRTVLGKTIERHTDQVFGLDKLPLHGPFIVASNHIDFLDGFYLAYYMSEKTFRKVYFLSRTNNYFLLRTTIQVDKNNPDKSLDYAINVLNQGHCVCIFPESKRNTDINLLPGKTGVARLAMHTRLPLVPVGIMGPSGANAWDSFKLMRSKEEKIWMNIGSPITYWEYYRRDATPDIIDAVTRHIMQSIAYLAHRKYPY